MHQLLIKWMCRTPVSHRAPSGATSPPQSRDWINFFDQCFLGNNSNSGKRRQGNELALVSQRDCDPQHEVEHGLGVDGPARARLSDEGVPRRS